MSVVQSLSRGEETVFAEERDAWVGCTSSSSRGVVERMVRHQHLVRFRIVIQRTLVLHKLFFSPFSSSSSSRAGETNASSRARSGRARQTPSRRRRLANRRTQNEPSSSVPLERADMVENAAVASATKTSKPTRSVNAADDATSGPSGDSRPWWRSIKTPRVSLHDEPVWGVKVSKVRDDAREDFVCGRTFAFSHFEGGESRARRVARAMVVATTRARGSTNDGLTNDARLARADV